MPTSDTLEFNPYLPETAAMQFFGTEP